MSGTLGTGVRRDVYQDQDRQGLCVGVNSHKAFQEQITHTLSLANRKPHMACHKAA